MAYYAAPFTFDFVGSKIEIDAGVTDIDCAALYAAIKVAQASEEGILYERVGRGSGLNILGPGVQVGLTVEVLGAWQLRFPSGNYIARIAGGNFIGGPGGDPIAYTAGVQALLIQSAASTVVTAGGSVPTAAQNAAAVRTELATELARVDVAVSSRNAVAPPNAAQNAAAVWSEAIEPGLSAKQAARLIAAVAAGDLTENDGVATVKAVGGTKTRVTATVDGTNRDVTALDTTDG